MDIGLTYSEKDPRQAKAREFVRHFVEESGMLASILEDRRNVKSPTLTINGHTLKDRRHKPRGKNPPMFPGLQDLAAALEHHLWSL